jgi:hypothetical protein
MVADTQVSPQHRPVQAPQLRVPPQPLPTLPQIIVPHAVARSSGVQPQTFAVVPPPQVSGATHWVVPQST